MSMEKFEPKQNIYMSTLKTDADLQSAIEQFMKYTGTTTVLTFPEKGDSPHDYYCWHVIFPDRKESTKIESYFHCDKSEGMTNAERNGHMYAKLVNHYFTHTLWFLNVINLQTKQPTPTKEKKKIPFKPLSTKSRKKNE